jgi:hypothetical protein
VPAPYSGCITSDGVRIIAIPPPTATFPTHAVNSVFQTMHGPRLFHHRHRHRVGHNRQQRYPAQGASNQISIRMWDGRCSPHQGIRPPGKATRWQKLGNRRIIFLFLIGGNATLLKLGGIRVHWHTHHYRHLTSPNLWFITEISWLYCIPTSPGMARGAPPGR